MEAHSVIRLVIEQLGYFIEYVGLTIIVISILVALVKLILPKYSMGHIRHALASRIIFGLEFVIAADILLATVVTDVGQIVQLGGIVLIRVILGYSLRKEAGLK